MPRKKSDLSFISKASRSKRKSRAKLKAALSQLPSPGNHIPLSEEELQREREMNEAIYAEIMAKNKEIQAKRLAPQPQPKPKLKMQPPRDKRSLESGLQDSCFKSKTESIWLRDYEEFVEPQPLLMPIKSRPTNILVKEARKSHRAELNVERKKRAALRAEKQRLIKLECNANESLREGSQEQLNEQNALVQEQCALVCVKVEPCV